MTIVYNWTWLRLKTIEVNRRSWFLKFKGLQQSHAIHNEHIANII